MIASVQASFTGCAENGGRSFFKLPNMAWESIIATDIYLTTMLHLQGHRWQNVMIFEEVLMKLEIDYGFHNAL